MDMMMAAERRRAEEELLCMLPAWRCPWCKPRPAPASVPRRGETDSAAVTVSDGAAGRAWIASERVRVRSAGCG